MIWKNSLTVSRYLLIGLTHQLSHPDPDLSGDGSYRVFDEVLLPTSFGIRMTNEVKISYKVEKDPETILNQCQHMVQDNDGVVNIPNSLFLIPYPNWHDKSIVN